MTEYEIKLCLALGRCSFLPGSSQKRFCRNMAFVAEHSPEKEISLRQRHYLELMAWRYRRQLADDLVPHSKSLNLPRSISVKKRKSKVPKKSNMEGNLL